MKRERKIREKQSLIATDTSNLYRVEYRRKLKFEIFMEYILNGMTEVDKSVGLDWQVKKGWHMLLGS